MLALRKKRLATSQRAYYKKPMNLQRGRGVWMYDEDGYGYLDSLNNVTHVGHANPRVAAAANRQMHKLNTNSRFIYEGIATYADKLVSTLPKPLEVVFLVCSGSEANDLALRIARQVTRPTGHRHHRWCLPRQYRCGKRYFTESVQGARRRRRTEHYA